MKDFYKILGVERTASAQDIKQAYLKLIKTYHPDLHPDDEENLMRFQEITEAYRALGDLDNRLKYSAQLNSHIRIKKPK